RHRELDEGKRRAGVDWKQTSKPLDVERWQRTDWAELARVVDEDVQAAQLAGRIDPGTTRGRIGDVAGNRHDPPAGSGPGDEIVANAIERLRASRANDEVVTPFAQHPGDDLAESAARSRNQCHAVRFVHVVLLTTTIDLQVHLKSRGNSGKLSEVKGGDVR